LNQIHQIVDDNELEIPAELLGPGFRGKKMKIV